MAFAGDRPFGNVVHAAEERCACGALTFSNSKLTTANVFSDAAHSMVNRMAQETATSMEDGAFLARTPAMIVQERPEFAQTLQIYEKTRMPLS